MAKSKNLSDVLDDFVDDAIVHQFQEDEWFDTISYMSPNGMLALVVTIVWEWMKERVKENTPLSVRYDMADTFGKSLANMLKETIKDKYDK